MIEKHLEVAVAEGIAVRTADGCYSKR
jgi:hypothetical protein